MPFGIPGSYGKVIKKIRARSGGTLPKRKKPIKDIARRPFGQGTGKGSGGSVRIGPVIRRGLTRKNSSRY